MVSAELVDALSDPTGVIAKLYTANIASNDFPGIVASHFEETFRDDDAFHQIPQLNNNDHHPITFSSQYRPLVQFRCMIQDTSSSPELFSSQLPGGSVGGWGLADEWQGEIDSPVEGFGERSSVWAVSVPGEANWVSQSFDGNSHIEGTLKSMQPHKYPFPSQAHLGVQLKIYGSKEPPKITEVVTVVGILTDSLYVSTYPNGFEEIDVPTIHVLFIRNQNPSLPTPQSVSLGSTRSDLIAWLAQEGLGGDQDAAEWVLLAVAGKVHSRASSLLPPSISITSFPPPPPTSTTSSTHQALEPTLVHVLSQILPLSVHLPLSILFLNESRFVPKSQDEDLHSGMLQLPFGTTVVVSDGAVSEGVLKDAGVLNVQALKQCIGTQTLSYVFPYHQFSFPTDLNFIVLTQGTKSPFVETEVYVPLQPTLPSSNFLLYKPAEEIRMPPADKLEAFRALIAGAKSRTANLTKAASDYISNDFVNERQSGQQVTPDDLALRMSITRLMALTRNESEISRETWLHVKDLDIRRKARLSK